jgi:hypothetical protein
MPGERIRSAVASALRSSSQIRRVVKRGSFVPSEIGRTASLARNASAVHLLILHDTLADCLAGVRDDLEAPEVVKDPEQAREEADAYQRLLAGLARGKILVPDEAALSAVKKIATADDEASNYAEIAANHDALHGLLSLLEGERG